ncbi:MAG: DUF4430 domain-containing protein [Clostridia bacterium]|nr:DUF4430 domain-containing protein [Clostridia bacterium]
MKNKAFIQSSVIVLLVVLIAAMALLCGCTTNQPDEGGNSTLSSTTTTTAAQPQTVGEGETSFAFTVTFLDGASKQYVVRTDKTTVGAALLEVGLIAGSDSQYGLMVESVDGVKLDYTADKAYWAFYVDGAYAMSGVDSTTIETGKSYAFTATPA